MTVLKRIDRNATVGFAPHSGLMAAGTVAGAIDMSFSTSSVLELYALDFASSGDALPMVGSAQAPERFNRLAWGPRMADNTYKHGILAGGLADGSVVLWDPAAILNPSAGKAPSLAKMQKHTGAVKGLEFNTFSPNLLASGAADGDLCIWDVAKPAQPSMYPALKGGSGPGGEITFLAWNCKVQHILASSLANGSCVVWDLKRQKPVISFQDQSVPRRASVLQWNPEVATQLVVASDDDRSPTLQMWDLRNSVSPLKEFVGHTKGVLGMAWSHHDSALLLSSAKDNRTICWDVHSATPLCELPASANWAHDVQWSPTIPGVFSTASFDGHVELHSLASSCTQGKGIETMNADFSVSTSPAGDAVPLKKAPAWMKRPAGASFGFGGKLVAFSNARTAGLEGVPLARPATVSVSQLVTEQELVQRSEAFEVAIAGGDRGALAAFCAEKGASAAGTPDEAETWSFLSLLFEGDGRRELLKRLGFEDMIPPPPPSVEDAAAAAAAAVEALSIAASPSGATPTPSSDDFFTQQQGAEDFFDHLPEQPEPAPAAPAPKAVAAAAAAAAHDGPTPDGSTEAEADVQRAMVAGNYEAAVDACFTAGRLADALLIANVFNSSDLYKRTMARYMARCPKPFMSILTASIDSDFGTLVRTRPVSAWRETMALLATYTAQEEWALLCDELANRLSTAGMHHAASLCYVCAGNVDGAVGYWSRAVAGATSGGSAAAVAALQSVIEKSVVFGLATGGKNGSSNALSELVTSYAGLLASQGHLTTALDYLEMVPGEASTHVAVLKDRIFRSGAPLPQNVHAPPFPFILEDVRPSLDQGPMGGMSVSAPSQASVAANGGYYGAHAAASPVYGQQQGQQQQVYSAQPAYAPQQQQYAAQQQPAAAAAPAAGGYGGYGVAAAAAPAAGSYANAAPSAPAYAAAPAAAPVYGGYGAQATASYTAPASQPAAPNPYTNPHAYTTSGQYGGGSTAPAASAYTPSPPPAPEPLAGGVYSVAKKASAPAAAQPAAAASSYASYNPNAAQAQPMQQQQQGYGAPAPMMPQQQQGGWEQQQQPAQTVTAPSYFRPETTTTAAAVSQRQGSGGYQQQQQGMMGGTGAQGGGAGGGPMGAPPGGSYPGQQGQQQQQAPAPPPPPAGPPANATVLSVDTSAVGPEQRPIVATLTQLYDACVPLASNPVKKREMEDNTKKLGQLFWRLNAGEVSASALPKLLQLCGAIAHGDWHTANHIQVQMTTTDWDECGYWLSAVKRLIKMRQTGH
ncbi:hypothetical protein FOA52_004037 [Chlamydomonas sp. UWO 241]|nr:hypothetical protein FOA52_004037 [Chlamydomonas sp. UWO 241]